MLRTINRSAIRGLSTHARVTSSSSSNDNTTLLTGAAILLSGLTIASAKQASCDDAVATPPTTTPHGTADLPEMYRRLSRRIPEFSLEKFRAGQDDRIWVALDGGIYDVTPFLDAHPGGVSRIMMVQGQDLGKYWGVYQLHDRPHIRALLEGEFV